MKNRVAIVLLLSVFAATELPEKAFGQNAGVSVAVSAAAASAARRRREHERAYLHLLKPLQDGREEVSIKEAFFEIEDLLGLSETSEHRLSKDDQQTIFKSAIAGNAFEGRDMNFDLEGKLRAQLKGAHSSEISAVNYFYSYHALMARLAHLGYADLAQECVFRAEVQMVEVITEVKSRVDTISDYLLTIVLIRAADQAIHFNGASEPVRGVLSQFKEEMLNPTRFAQVAQVVTEKNRATALGIGSLAGFLTGFVTFFITESHYMFSPHNHSILAGVFAAFVSGLATYGFMISDDIPHSPEPIQKAFSDPKYVKHCETLLEAS